MGILDNVKSRLGFGTAATSDHSWHDDSYPDEHYENIHSQINDNGNGNGSGYSDIYSATIRNGRVISRSNNRSNRGGRSFSSDENFERPSAMRTFGVDRADYYSDNHVPLVSQHDVRSQPLPSTVNTGYVPDRIPAPKAYPRFTPRQTDASQEDDASAFKNGLARTPSSFAQLHSARLRMEDSGKIIALGTDAVRGSSGFSEADDTVDGMREAGFNQVRQRVYRKVEHVVPITYADAEQIALELKKGYVVVLDLRTTRPDLAKRILDFSFGVASALDGQVERFIDRVYLFTLNGAVQDVERAAIRV